MYPSLTYGRTMMEQVFAIPFYSLPDIGLKRDSSQLPSVKLSLSFENVYWASSTDRYEWVMVELRGEFNPTWVHKSSRSVEGRRRYSRLPPSADSNRFCCMHKIQISDLLLLTVRGPSLCRKAKSSSKSLPSVVGVERHISRWIGHFGQDMIGTDWICQWCRYVRTSIHLSLDVADRGSRVQLPGLSEISYFSRHLSALSDLNTR